MRTLIAGLLFSVALIFALPAGAVSTPGWQGTWDTNWGPLVIGASDATFGYSDSWNEPLGHFRELKADGATLTGSWSHDPPSHFAPRDHGTFTLHMTLSGGKATFTGTMVYAYNGETTELRGTCKSGACAAAPSAPTVKALAASGKAGTTVQLRFRVANASGNVTVQLKVYRGSTQIYVAKFKPHAAGPSDQVSYKLPKQKGVLRFTIALVDGSGAASNASSASITVR